MMKDLYSFHTSKEDLEAFYIKAMEAYKKVFKRLSLDAKLVEASGGVFTKDYTHEFQVLTPVGEDTIVYCTKCDYAQNKEIALVGGGHRCPKCGADVMEGQAVEVGNVFRLGTRYSDAFDLKYTNEKGEKQAVVMGSYGIGPTRVMGTLVEVFNDEKGILWPEAVAPFKVHLIELKSEKSKVKSFAEKVYKSLQKAGIEVLYDDRDISPGAKFADADLIGCPWRALVSEKNGDKIELKARDSKTAKQVSLTELLKKLTK